MMSHPYTDRICWRFAICLLLSMPATLHLRQEFDGAEVDPSFDAIDGGKASGNRFLSGTRIGGRRAFALPHPEDDAYCASAALVGREKSSLSKLVKCPRAVSGLSGCPLC